MSTVYVLNKNGEPLMPTTRCGHVRILLKQGRARVVNQRPFTIQLLYDTPNGMQPIILGIDPGRTNIGLCAVKEIGKPVFTAQVKTRNKEVPKLMAKRLAFRRAHRNDGRRKKRYRRAKAAGTLSSMCINGEFKRLLPGYEKPVTCKGIKNKEARFNNRLRPAGWLTPTANHLLRTHLNIVSKIQKFIPITDIVLEGNSFDFMKMDNPNIRNEDYQHGPLFGYEGLENAVNDIQGGHCLLCENKIEHYHHVVPRSKRGSNTVDNITGLCAIHHRLVHTDDTWTQKLKSKKAGLNKKYGALSVLNQIIPTLEKELSERFAGHFFITKGWKTKAFRDEYAIAKDHYIDGYCIACSILSNITVEVPEKNTVYNVLQFRRHDRQACHQAMLNRKYVLDGKVVAVNRHKAIEQYEDSLDEYIANGGRTDVLTVKPHKAAYKRMNRIMPGAVFNVKEKRKVMVSSMGLYKGVPAYFIFADGTKINPKKCSIVLQNTGLVFA